MWNYFLKGGPLMWPLLLFSIAALSIIINRLIFYYRISHDEEILMKRIRNYLSRAETAKALDAARRAPGPVAAVLKAGLEKFADGREAMAAAMEEEGLREIPKLEQYLSVLSTIASVATLTGFTGTVTGMIGAFNSIAAQGVSSPAIIARGISEALITTATGLIVAIPTLVSYHYFSFRLDRFILDIERYSKELLGLR